MDDSGDSGSSDFFEGFMFGSMFSGPGPGGLLGALAIVALAVVLLVIFL